MAVNKKRGLGRGLDSLFNDNAVDQGSVNELDINEIEPNRDQPRKEFDQQALNELADSIATHGLLQPIVVRPMSNLRYQIVAGERRWRASRIAGLERVPVIIREMSDMECMELAMIENLQREDLNPVEEALGYRQLIDSYSMTQDEVAQAVGKSRPAVANALRLLSLPSDLLEMVSAGELSAGHARALLAIEDAELRSQAAKWAKDGATVREIEKLGSKRSKSSENSAKQPILSYYKEVELALTAELGRKVKVSGAKGKGTLTIEFYSDSELSDMAMKLSGDK